MIETYLGFDVGTKRTGVAIANSLTQHASGLEVVNNHKNGAIDWAAFDKVIQAHNATLFVVGLPYDQDGKEQEMTFVARAFGRKLRDRYGIDVVFIDEYLSSFDAKKQLKYNHYHPNAKRGEVDKQSSQIILQSYLNEKSFD